MCALKKLVRSSLNQALACVIVCCCGRTTVGNAGYDYVVAGGLISFSVGENVHYTEVQAGLYAEHAVQKYAVRDRLKAHAHNVN